MYVGLLFTSDNISTVWLFWTRVRKLTGSYFSMVTYLISTVYIKMILRYVGRMAVESLRRRLCGNSISVLFLSICGRINHFCPLGVSRFLGTVLLWRGGIYPTPNFTCGSSQTRYVQTMCTTVAAPSREKMKILDYPQPSVCVARTSNPPLPETWQRWLVKQRT